LVCWLRAELVQMPLANAGTKLILTLNVPVAALAVPTMPADVQSMVVKSMSVRPRISFMTNFMAQLMQISN
jgi:hypothetical protein